MHKSIFVKNRGGALVTRLPRNTGDSVMKLIYQGFDGLDVSFQGIFPEEIRYQLKVAKDKAYETRKEVKALLGEKEIPVLVQPSGARGYQFIFDTGIDREIWWLADNNKSDRWNIRTSVKSFSLALYGYKGVKANILSFLDDMGARGANKDFSLLERVSRFDYCFDFISNNFSINPKCICAHSNMKRDFIGGNRLITKNKDIETVMIGKMPNRQLEIYNKLKEIIIKRKEYWFDLWGIDKEKLNNNKIWRFEIRAGKEELNSWNLKRFSDFEEKAGDVLFDIADSIRYVKPNYKDKNKARWKNKEFWDLILKELKTNLFNYSSNSERNKLIPVFKHEKEQEYLKLITNLIAPYMAIKNYSFDELALGLTDIERYIAQQFHDFPDIQENKIKDAKDRFVFLD